MDTAGTEFLTDMDSEKKEQQEKDTDTTTANTQSEHIPGISNLTSTLETPAMESALASDSKQQNKSIQSFHVLIQKAFEEFSLFDVSMFGKVVLSSSMGSLEFQGETIHCPQNSALRIGDEVFVSSDKRVSAQGKTFVIFGFFPFDQKHLERTWVVLVDRTAPRLPNELFTVFRAAPISVVGILPGNRGIDATGSDVEAVEPLFRQLLEKLSLSGNKNPLALLDFTKPATSTPKIKVERPKRKNAGCSVKEAPASKQPNLPAPVLKHPPRTLLPKTSDTSESHYLNKKQSTPSHIKRIEKKLDLILESEDEREKKENQNTARKLGQIEHFKRKNALLSEENSKLNARLQECETVKAHNQQLLVDNDNLQKRNKDLGAENSAQLVEIERLSTENCLLRGLLKSDNSRRHKSN